jgi:hypothetical protein
MRLISFPRLMQRGAFGLVQRQFKATQKSLTPVGWDLRPECWIKTVDWCNAGTSRVANVLAESPSIGGLTGEGVILTNALPYPEQFGWSGM